MRSSRSERQVCAAALIFGLAPLALMGQEIIELGAPGGKLGERAATAGRNVKSCFTGRSIATTDPTSDPPGTSSSTADGFGAAGCAPRGAQFHYDLYQVNLSTCSAFPTTVTVTLCDGTCGTIPPGPPPTNDLQLAIYRSLPLATDGGTAGPYNPAAGQTCTNARVVNNDLGQTSSSPLGACAANSGAPGIQRSFGSGFFDIVITHRITTDALPFNYVLSIDAPNCTVAPSDVKFAKLKVKDADGNTRFEWATASEMDNLGFHLYSEKDGKRVRLTPGLIAGSALMAGPGTPLTAGKTYTWLDQWAKATPGTEYWLEELDLNGASRWYGPATVEPDSPESAKGSARMLNKLGEPARRSATDTHPVETRARVASVTGAGASRQASLAASRGIKLSLKSEGWYRVDAGDLFAAGLDPAADASTLQLFADGSEEPMNVIAGEDGRLAAIEFHGVGVDSAVTDVRNYWLISGQAAGRRISRVGSPADISVPQPAGDSFLYTVERRDRTVYFGGLRNGETENFFGAVVTADPVEQVVRLANVARAAGKEAEFELVLQGVTTSAHHVEVLLNDNAVGSLDFDGQTIGTLRAKIAQSLLREGDNIVTLRTRGESSDVSLVDAIRIGYWHAYAADDNALRLTAEGGKGIAIDGFRSSAVRVLDLTGEPLEIAATVQKTESGYMVAFNAPGDGQRQLLALAEDQIRSAAAIRGNQPSEWRTPGHEGELVILTRQEFVDSVLPLKKLRESQGLSVSVIDVEDLYDEFSYGQKSPQAIKDFLSYAAANWRKAPKYLLLAGDASLDPKNYLGYGDFDLVPTKLIDTNLIETASDDWFVTPDHDSLPSLAVGRLPVRTIEQADAMIAKIIGYENAGKSSSVLLVSDATQDYNFESMTAQLKPLISKELTVEEIRRGATDPDSARRQFADSISKGQKVVNYTGHGSVDLWKDNLLTSAEAGSLNNAGHLPFFVMMTCLNGYFQDPGLDSLAKALMKAEKGGAVAVWASTGLTVPYNQTAMNEQMYKLIFDGADGNAITLGEATARAKAATEDSDVRRTWVLLGDPSMKLQ